MTTQLCKSGVAPSYAYIWDGVIVYAGAELVNTPHTHFAASIQIALDAPNCITLPNGDKVETQIAVIAPNVCYATDSRGGPLIDIMIDQDHPAFCHLPPLLQGRNAAFLPWGQIQSLMPRLRHLRERPCDLAQVHHLLTELLAALSAPLAQLPWDGRLLQVTAYLRQQVVIGSPSIAQVAAQVCLSPSRVMHLFRSAFGLPVRQFQLWLRLQHASWHWREGQTMNALATEAGFFDQAHFTRTMVSMLGRTPLLVAHQQLVVVRDETPARISSMGLG